MTTCTWEELVIIAPASKPKLGALARQWRATQGRRNALRRLHIMDMEEPIDGCSSASAAEDFYGQHMLAKSIWNDIIESCKVWYPPVPVISCDGRDTRTANKTIVTITMGTGRVDNCIQILEWGKELLAKYRRHIFSIEAPYAIRWQVYDALENMVDGNNAVRDMPAKSVCSSKGDPWCTIKVYLKVGPYLPIDRLAWLYSLKERFNPLGALVGSAELVNDSSTLLVNIGKMEEITPFLSLIHSGIAIRKGQLLVETSSQE